MFYPFKNLFGNIELCFLLHKLENSRHCTSSLLIVVVSDLYPDFWL